MSWEDKKAVRRIFNTFKRVPKQIFQEDIEALKTINESLETKAKQSANDNLLFAKLLAVHLIQNVDFYKDINAAKRKVSEDLQKPLDYHLTFLTQHLNNAELHGYFKSLGLVEWNSGAELESNNSIITENQKEMTEKVKSSWNYAEVEKSFYATANTFLKNIDNYK